MAILGPVCPLSNNTCQTRNLPATDIHGSKVVIAACTHVLGTAKVSFHGADQDEIAIEATSVLAFTAWRSETREELWNQLCEGPLRVIWKIFSIDPSKNVVTRPWGRSWRTANAIADPDKAESFQVRVRVYTSVTATVLAQSGAQGVFVNPKNADGANIDTSFAVIWLRDKDRAQALEAAKKIPEHAGLVLSTRGKSGHGLRVPSTVYEEAQSILNPSNPRHAHIPANFYVKLSPLPHGVTQDDIRTWLDKQALRMRPIRSLAANTWLLASSTKVDACHYLWGRSTVLIALIASVPPKQPTVLAGGKRLTTLPPVQTATGSMDEPFQDDSWDPWRLWNPVLGDGSTKSFGSSRIWSSKASQQSNSSTNPSSAQSSEIAAIQVQIRDLSKATKANQDSEQKLRQDMQNEFARVRTEVKTQIEASEISVRATLDQRIHCMERSLQETNTGMKEGFTAILARLGQPASAEAGKRPRPEGEMQVDTHS